MGKSLALSLYLLLADRGTAAIVTGRPDRPHGPLIWIHMGIGSRDDSIAHIARLLLDEKPDQTILVTHDPERSAIIPETLSDALPQDRRADVCAFLDHWSPAVALFIGASLPAALIAETHKRGIPLILADIHLDLTALPFWQRSLMGATLHQFGNIFAQDPNTASALQRLGGRSLVVELGGRLEDTIDPLTCVNADRDALAESLRARPVWLAAACPEIEELAVLSAHVHAMQHAHRLLLILAPVDASRAPALAEWLVAQGLNVAQRALEEDPLPDIQVLITDGLAELGLWYRLAPVCFMGGTLIGDGTGRSPYEPAALGSAILYGPNQGQHENAYARLAEARAARAVATPEALGAAVADLIAPDKAAVLAHNAWSTTSGGAEATQRIVNIALKALDTSQSTRVVR